MQLDECVLRVSPIIKNKESPLCTRAYAVNTYNGCLNLTSMINFRKDQIFDCNRDYAFLSSAETKIVVL